MNILTIMKVFARSINMKLKKYALVAAVAVLTFAFGISVYASAQLVLSLLSSMMSDDRAVTQPVVEIAPVPAIETKAPESAVVGLAEDAPEVADTEPEAEFDPSGDYYMPDDSRSKGFEDVENLEIIMRDYGLNMDHPTGIPIPPKGSLQTINNSFRFKRIAIGAREIAFQTEELNGISYKFTGEFLNKPIARSRGINRS